MSVIVVVVLLNIVFSIRTNSSTKPSWDHDDYCYSSSSSLWRKFQLFVVVTALRLHLPSKTTTLAFTPTAPLLFYKQQARQYHNDKWRMSLHFASINNNNDNNNNNNNNNSNESGDSNNDSNNNDKGNNAGKGLPRKRHVLPRSTTQIATKFNTDYLFRGMPSIESMLGGNGSSGKASSSSSNNSSNEETQEKEEQNTTYLQNQYMTEAEKVQKLNSELLISITEIQAIDDKYELQKKQSSNNIPDSLLLFDNRMMMGDENEDETTSYNDEYKNYFRDTKTKQLLNNNTTIIISRNEAKRIIDYTIEEDKNIELRNLRFRKKEELVAYWEEQSANVVDNHEIINNTSTNVNNNSNYDINYYENDKVVNEIVTNDEKRYMLDNAKQTQINELELYYKEQMIHRQLNVDNVNSDSRSSSNSADAAATTTTTTTTTTIDNGKSKDFDTMYEETINKLQSSRFNKLQARTYGVLSNSLALEDSQEYIRRTKRVNEFDTRVQRELLINNDEFIIIKPKTIEEDRIYRSIIRQIVHRRKEENNKERMIVEVVSSVGSSYDDNGNEDESTNFPNSSSNTKNSNKYELTVDETIESYKLLGLWREIKTIQDVMEVEVGIKDTIDYDYDQPSSTTTTTIAPKRIEPLFLYEENTIEKRQRDKDGLCKALRSILKLDAEKNNAELSSNELLMKELFIIDETAGGGITKDRALRLIDKLLQTTSDDTIKYTLLELKGVILEEDDNTSDNNNNNIGNDSTNMSTKGGGYRFRKSKTITSSGPIDLSEVFRTSNTSDSDDTINSHSSPPPSSSVGSGFSRTMPSWVGRGDEDITTTLSSPNVESLDVSSDSTSDSYNYNNDEDYENEEDDEVNVKSSNLGAGMFGTYEEQRLRKLAKRVGAQTELELDELRRNMESLRLAEDMANAQLSNDENFDLAAESAKLGIDVKSINLDDDNDDQIMSMIGKRPMKSSLSSSTTTTTTTITSSNASETNDGVIVSASVDIVGDIFRAKNAGKYDDRQARDADEAAFRDFVMMEVEAERKLDVFDGGSTADQSTIAIDDIDIDAYADDIMSEMKPRPQARRPRREDVMSQEELQREKKMEGIIGNDEDLFFPTSSLSLSNRQVEGGTTTSGDIMPEWFRKEQLGVTGDDSSDDDDVDNEEEVRRAWEREVRQQKADEYLKRRGDGISISDILGREYFGPTDDEADDYYERARLSTPFDSFQARKELLLGYTELTVEDINNVVDYKTDPLSTGYNRYLSKIQRPFSEYGAIFRLEGVLVDMIGLHAKAWNKVSETYGYTLQSREDVKQASLYKPEDAVRGVFYWTDDIFDLRDIATIHSTAFREAFEAWVKSGGNVFADDTDEQGPLASDTDSLTIKATPSVEEMNSMYFIAWSKLAKDLDKIAPTSDQVYRGVLGGDWEAAVRDIFCWSNDVNEAYEIVVAYDKILQNDYKLLLNKYGIDLDKMNAKAEETRFGLDFPDISVQQGVREWMNTLREVDMPCSIVTYLDSSQLDIVLTRTGLAEYFPIDLRVSSDSSYPSERSQLLGAALRMEQRPDQCIVFDNTPTSAKEAHEIDMKCISFVNHYARYELLTADLSVGDMSNLDLQSLVKLFDRREDLEPLLELDLPLLKEKRKVKTAFWDD